MYILEKEYGKENFEKEFEKLKLEAIVMLADDERERMESNLFDINSYRL